MFKNNSNDWKKTNKRETYDINNNYSNVYSGSFGKGDSMGAARVEGNVDIIEDVTERTRLKDTGIFNSNINGDIRITACSKTLILTDARSGSEFGVHNTTTASPDCVYLR